LPEIAFTFLTAKLTISVHNVKINLPDGKRVISRGERAYRLQRESVNAASMLAATLRRQSSSRWASVRRRTLLINYTWQNAHNTTIGMAMSWWDQLCSFSLVLLRALVSRVLTRDSGIFRTRMKTPG